VSEGDDWNQFTHPVAEVPIMTKAIAFIVFGKLTHFEVNHSQNDKKHH